MKDNVESLISEIKALEEKMSRSKDQTEKAVLRDTINAKKAELDSIGVKESVKEIKVQKEAPDRIDHKSDKSDAIGRGSITNVGDTFVGIL